MNATRLVKCAGALIALAICSACGGVEDRMAVAPSSSALNATTYVGRTLSVNGRLVTAARVNLGPPPRYATILPNLRRRSETFEYVINNYGSYAGIFDYPKSDKQIGSIDHVGGQGCTNVLYGYGKKRFWIVAGVNQITEYHVPRKPLKTLSAPAGSMPSSCAMNAGGDLAVGILSGTDAGDVLIFKNASGTPTIYTTPLIQEFFDGYDNQGNLFADGFNRFDRFTLAELPKSGSQFQTITTDNTVHFPGSVQWDGKYLTVLDQLTNAISRYTVSGTQATSNGTVTLKGSADCAQSWIVKGIVYCGDAGNDDGEVFKYPAGGSPIAILTGNFDTPLGVVAAAK